MAGAGEVIEHRLPYAPPLAADALFRFLGDRTIPGVESFDGTTFRRAVRQPDAIAAVIELAAHPDRGEVRLRVFGSSERTDPSVLLATARRLLDLDADPSIVDTALSLDPSLRPLVRTTPGLRRPGTADGFELVVRAILGQQISVRAARTFAGRIARRADTARAAGRRRHPSVPDRGATGDDALDGLGLTTAREATLRRVAELVASGELDLSGAADLEVTRERLRRCGHRAVDRRVRVDARSEGPGRVPAEISACDSAESLGLASTPQAIRDHAERWRPWRAMPSCICGTASTASMSAMAEDDRYERGRARFLEVHDEKALRAVEGLGDLGRSIVGVYGDIYLRPGLSLRDRELAAVATLVALGRSSQIPQHLRAALKAGVSSDELREVIIQTAAIAGFPPAMNAMSTLKTVLAETTREAAD